MEAQAWTIKELARTLGQSEATIRRRVKKGTLKAKLGTGAFGKTWYITELPPEYAAKLQPPTIAELRAEIDKIIARFERLFRAVANAEKGGKG